MAVVWTFNVPDVGTRRVFSIEDRIWDGQRMSVSAMIGRTLGASRGVPRQIRTRGGGLGDDFKAASLQRHFWVRNAPYALKDRGNPLKSQQMRAPSERTTGNKPLMRKIFSRFLLPHCYSQRALVFVPRNLPYLISRVLAQCLLLRSSHLF
jgi:hypothetical protein